MTKTSMPWIKREGGSSSRSENDLWRSLQVVNLKHTSNLIACIKHLARLGILHIHTMINK